MKTNRTIQASTLGMLVVAAAGFAAGACSQDATPATTSPMAAQRATTSIVAPTDAQRLERLAQARARARWVGDAHHAAMQVVIRDLSRYKRARKRIPRIGSAEYCATMERAGDAALEVLDAHRGIQRDRGQRLARMRSEPQLAGCSPTLSIFHVGAPAPLLRFQEGEPEVTGAYEHYLDPMYYAVQGTNGSVAAVSQAVSGVLGGAVSDGIPEGDLLALAAFAGLVESSAVEWNSFDWSIADGSGDAESGDQTGSTSYEMSIFRLREFDKRVLGVVVADAAGCISTVKGWGALKALLVGPAWVALAGECGLRATLASGMAIWALM